MGTRSSRLLSSDLEKKETEESTVVFSIET